MVTRPPENPPSKEEIEQGQTRQIVIPGYLPICDQCVFRDIYMTSKQQGTLINNLRDQLLALTREMEDLKAQVEGEEEAEEAPEE